MVEQVNQVGTEKDALKNLKAQLEQQLNDLGIKLGEAEQKIADFPDEAIPTLIIKNIPTEGSVRFGGSVFERNNRIIYFDSGEAPKLKKLTIVDCPEIIKLDLDHCANLEKLSIKKSRLDTISNLNKCIKLKKVSIKESIDFVPSDFLAGTNVEELKIT